MESQKPEEMAETASNQQIDREMQSNEEEFAGSKPVPDGFFADINNSQACSVRVALKCRPLLGRELYEKQSICVETDEVTNTIMIGKDRQFTFDKVFGIGSAQEDVFEFCVKNLVLGCFQGYNATVLAYGQTGSGKTFTMGSGYTIGVSEENMGIIPRVNKFIFDEIEARKSKAEFIVKCAFLEIYNEELIDLLDCSATTTMLDRIIPQKKEINIREEKNGMISVYPLKEVEVKSPEELAQCLDLGSNQRSVASTLMNQQSSRSHGIFTITIEQHFIEDLLTDGVATKTANQDEFMIAKFHFVDLAGSERAKKTGATGATMKEGININKSLLSLGNVIAALTDEAKKNAHVPYRDSKLTRILQDSLGGNSRTSMIACCSPAETNFEETLNTLKYASRARNIKNKPVVNRDPASLQIAALRQQVYELQMELSNTRDVLNTHQIPFQTTIVLPAKNSLMQIGRQVQPQPQMQVDLMSGAEIKKMEASIQELKAAVSSKEKELQQTRAKLEALQDQHQTTQIEQFGAQRDRDLCRYQLEQVIAALKKHKTVLVEVVKEINGGKLPSDFNPLTATADQILDPVFGCAGPTVLQEYQTKVEEQRIEMEKQKLALQQFINDNQQLIEQATRDTKSLEQKELEIERLKRQTIKQQKEIEQIQIDHRKPLISSSRQPIKTQRRATELPQMHQLQQLQDENWISNDLDNKIKHFEEVRKGFIEEMTNQMSKALVPTVNMDLKKNDSDMDAEDEGSSLLDAEVAEDSNIIDTSQIDDDKELLAKINTQQREVSKLDSQMLDMEEVLAKFKASQRDMEQSLLKAMEEEYHNKIHLMQNELKRLDLMKSEDLKKATGITAKSKIENQFKLKETELQTKLSELKLKEREQSKLQQLLTQQKVKSKQLESELEKLKQHKVQMLKKMQDDQASMIKWKKQRAQEVMDLKKQILKKDKENDALKRENKKREIFAKRKQEEVIAMQQRQKLDQAKRQNATKQRQELQNVDANKIKEWILSQTEKYVDYRDIETEKDRELRECDKIELEIENQQEQFSKLIVAVEKLEQQKNRLSQAPEGTQDDKIYQLTIEIEDLTINMKDIQSHIESLEDKQAFINEKVSKYNFDLIRLKDPANANVLEESPLQSMEGVRATVQSFFDILLDLNMALRNVESELETRDAKLQSNVADLELLNSEIELIRRQKSLELKQVHQEYMEKEHKLIQFMIDNTGVDLGAKVDEESLQDINIQNLLSLFLKQKLPATEQRDNVSVNPGIVKASVATQRLKEEKQEAFAQSKAALARQVAELERQLQEKDVINKRLKNDQAQANAEKSKYKRLYDNEIDKNKKRPAKDDPTVQSHNFLQPVQQTSGGVQATQPLSKIQNLQNQRNQRKIKKMITMVPNSGPQLDTMMIGEEDYEEEQKSPTKHDVFSRLSQINMGRISAKARDAKHSFFGARRSSDTLRQGSPDRQQEPFEVVDEPQDLKQSWELVIDKPEAHKSQIYAMTSVGTHIYSSANKSLKIWDVETMKYISDLPEKIGLVKAIAFWNERNLLLTAAERVIMMWDVISLTTVGKFVGFKEEIKALQLVPGTDLMFAASKGTPQSGALLIYDLRKSQQPLDEKERSQDIFSLTANQSHIFYGCRNHTVNPFCIKTFTSLASLSPPHFDVVTSLSILGQQQHTSLISGSRDKNLRRYGIKDQYTADEAVLNAHNDQINALETDRDKTTLYSGSRDGIVKVWSMADPEQEGSLTCRAILEGNSQNSSVNTICKLEIDPSLGQAFACGSNDRSIRIWKYSHGQQLHSQRVSDTSHRQEPLPQVVPKSGEEQQQPLSTADRLRQRRLEKQLAQQNLI